MDLISVLPSPGGRGGGGGKAAEVLILSRPKTAH